MEGWPDSFRQQGWRWQAQGQANQTQPHTGKPEPERNQGVDVMSWEVFNPKDGKPLIVTRFEWVARCMAWFINGDYNTKGDGWA